MDVSAGQMDRRGDRLPDLFGIVLQGFPLFGGEAFHPFPADLVEDAVDFLLLVGALHVVAVIDGGVAVAADDEDGGVVLKECPRLHDQCEDHADEGAAEMGVVAYVVLSRPDAIDAEQHECECIEPGGYRQRYEEHADAHVRKERNTGKEYTENSSGCTDGAIVALVAVNEQGQQVSADEAAEIDEDEAERAECHLDDAAEKNEAQHIEDEMHPVDVKESSGD